MRPVIKGIAVILILLQLLCVGCWDQKDIGSLQVITMLGFDKITEDGVDKWQVSALATKPGGPENGDKASQGGGKHTEIVWTGKELTISDALLKISKRSPWIPFFADTYVLIIGERAAKEDMVAVVDFVSRIRQSRPRAFVLLTKGTASKIFETEAEAATSTSREARELTQRTASRTGIAGGINLKNFTSDLLSGDRDPVASEIQVIEPQEKKGEKIAGPEKSIIVEGLGVFKESKLVGWLNKEQAIGHSLITRTIRTGNIDLTIEKENTLYGFRIERSKPKIQVKLNDDKLHVQVAIDVAGTIVEANETDVGSEEIKQLEQNISENIRKMVLDTIETVQGYGSDCLGFSEKLHRYSLKDWQKVKTDWRETFKEADVEVVVTTSISNTGKIGQRLEAPK